MPYRFGDANGIVFRTNPVDNRPASLGFVDFAIGALQVDLEGMLGRGELTPQEHAVAFEQKIPEDLLHARERFLALCGDATTPTASPDQVASDPAHQASIAVLDNIDCDLNRVDDQRDAPVPLVGLPDGMRRIVDLLG